MKGVSSVVVILSLALVGMGAQGGSRTEPVAEQDPKIGKWKLRAQAPASGTREYEDRGCGVVVSTRQGINADGREYFSQYAVRYDGKEYPRLVKGSQTAGSISFTKVDPSTVAFTLREDGKITSRGTTSVSKDGKVLTVTTRREGSQGPGGVEIYDRQ